MIDYFTVDVQRLRGLSGVSMWCVRTYSYMICLVQQVRG